MMAPPRCAFCRRPFSPLAHPAKRFCDKDCQHAALMARYRRRRGMTPRRYLGDCRRHPGVKAHARDLCMPCYMDASRPARHSLPAASRRCGVPMQERTHCPRGHRYAGDNLYVRPDGRRECRTCRRAQWKVAA